MPKGKMLGNPERGQATAHPADGRKKEIGLPCIRGENQSIRVVHSCEIGGCSEGSKKMKKGEGKGGKIPL